MLYELKAFYTAHTHFRNEQLESRFGIKHVKFCHRLHNIVG